MTKKFEHILLIDDSDADNFFHRISIENTGLVENVECCQSASSALDYLTQKTQTKEKMPELIFLDINMPAVDGWEFLSRYESTVAPEQRSPKIFIVSTSMNPNDRKRAEAHPLVTAYVSKPLDSATFATLSDTLN